MAIETIFAHVSCSDLEASIGGACECGERVTLPLCPPEARPSPSRTAIRRRLHRLRRAGMRRTIGLADEGGHRLVQAVAAFRQELFGNKALERSVDSSPELASEPEGTGASMSRRPVFALANRAVPSSVSSTWIWSLTLDWARCNASAAPVMLRLRATARKALPSWMHRRADAPTAAAAFSGNCRGRRTLRAARFRGRRAPPASGSRRRPSRFPTVCDRNPRARRPRHRGCRR